MKISQFKVFLQKTQGYFENFKKIARSVSQARRNFYDQFGKNYRFDNFLLNFKSSIP